MLLGIGFVFLFFTLMVWFFCARRLSQKCPWAALKLCLGGLFLTGITSLLFTIIYGVYALQALSYRQPVATIVVHQIAPQHFNVVLTVPHSKQRMSYLLNGDQWLLGAQVMVWKSWLQRLGIRNHYQLAFLTSRYENGQPGQHDYVLGPLNHHAWLQWLYHDVLRHIAIETIEGSAVYMPLKDRARYRVLLAPSGLMAKRIPLHSESHVI